MKQLGLWSLYLVVYSSVIAQPADITHLEWIERTGINAGVIRQCLDCNSEEIILPSPFPFGPSYYNTSLYVGTNGIISFGSPFQNFIAVPFPSTNSSNVYLSHIVAPYWTDNDARRAGSVSWEMYDSGNRTESDEIIDRINSFIRMNTMNKSFNGSFLFVGTWSEMHPYPAGENFYYAQQYYHMNNSYQAVLITDGEEKSFAIFIFKCGALAWSGRTTIGFNAGANYYINHPLSIKPFSNAVACLNNNSAWNNIVYDLTSSSQNHGFSSGPESLLCSKKGDCSTFHVESSIYDCCQTVGAYTYITGSRCLLCYEYGWVRNISEDRQSALPVAAVNAIEGDTIDLSIFFLQNGPSNKDSYSFTIIAGGSALNTKDYNILSGLNLELNNEPLSVSIQTVDDDAYEGTETIYLTLVQSTSSNNVTYSTGLISETVVITVEDNDKLGIEFNQTTMTISEDVGDITVSVTAVGNTTVPIAINFAFFGTATESEDYVWAGSHTLKFISSKTWENIVISIVNDTVIEGTESLIISLTDPQPLDAIHTTGTTTIMITNDDFPHIGFEQALYTVSEMEGSIDVCVNVLTGPVIDSLIVSVQVMSSSASDDDFRLSTESPKIHILPGMSRGCLTITVIRTEMVEREEQIQLTISRDTTIAVVKEPTTTVVIQDHGVVGLGFERELYTVSEGGLIEVVVAKSVPCDFDIHCRVYADGLVDQDVVLEATEGTAVVSIILPDDEVALEPDEIHLLTLSLVVYDPQVDLGQSLSHLTIIDDDKSVTVGFDEMNRTVSEDGGGANVSVSLRNEAAVSVSVDVVVVNGTAIEGQDFIVAGSPHLTFTKQENQTFSVQIVDDDEREENETFFLSLTSAHPSEGIFIYPGIFNFTIPANDGTGKSSMSTNYLLLLPLISIVTIAIVIVVVAISCRQRRMKQKKLKTHTLHCSNPLSDNNNHYDIPITPRGETDSQQLKKKEVKIEQVARVAVQVLPPPVKPRRKPSASITSRAKNKQVMRDAVLPPVPPRQKPSVSVASSATEVKIERVMRTSVQPPVPPRQKPTSVSVASSATEVKIEQVTRTNVKVLPPPVPPRQKPSVSIASNATESRSEEGSDDVGKKEKVGKIGIALPQLYLDQPEVKPNIAYGCVQIPSSEYAVPQRLSQQQRARRPLLPSEMQSVEAYAITNL